ncbi:site-specific integrase [Enterococcus wangshanyuanii]|uniref:Site-specific integrase n=1 Tax=Enterococcus wangshanyuanii TaxID=2005703 RepID=A0ABQ1PAV7_9ENTE|nr:site-specific integrase [Enterococcus wangshanyuanii]GGC90659.1 site-specific integrase [Enterococcus wangshanyuanii]
MARKSNVYKDNNGWYFKASLGTDPITGKRRTKTKRGFKTEREAKKAYMEFMLLWEFQQEDVEAQMSENMTFKEFTDTVFLPWYQSQVKPNTYNRRVLYLKERFSIFNDKNLREVTKLEVQLFQSQLVSENLSGSYINLLFSLGGMIWDRAKVFDLVQENPFREVGRVRNNPKKIKFWTVSDFQDFERKIFTPELESKVMGKKNLAYAEYYDFFHYLYFRFLFFTGLRFGESATLLWENMDLENGKLKVEYTLGNVAKHKNEQYMSSPKTKSSERELYVDSKTLKLLGIWKDYQSKVGGIELVFSHDGTFLDQGWIWKKFRTLQEKLELPYISVHDLRHSHASLLVYLGENPKMIQERLGHANIEMTLGTYSHLYPNQDIELVKKLDQVN